MRMMVRFRFPVEAGNEAIRSGRVARVFEAIMTDLKPEAAYFFPEGGERARLMAFDMQDASQVAGVAERFFHGLNARIEMTPVMTGEDLHKALSGMEATIQRFGQ